MDSANERKLFKQFVYAERLSFSQLVKKTKVPSNLIAYFLKKMLSKSILQKTSAGLYELSSKGEKLLPFYTEQESINPLVVILVVLVHNGKVLLSKRMRRPYRGLWSILSGRMVLGESIESAAKRVCLQKAGVECDFLGTSAVVHERMIQGEAKHSFVFFVTKAELNNHAQECISSAGEELKWFSISRPPKKGMIASDYWIIKNRVNSKADVVEEIMSKNGKKLKVLA